MATRFKSRARRSRRYLTIVKPSGSLHPRVQKVGPEHFGIVAVDCAKDNSVSVHHRTIRCQFIIIASLARTIRAG